MSRPNPMKGESEVTLSDGRTLKFAFDANAWIDIEEMSREELGARLTMKQILDRLSPKEGEDEPEPDLKFQRLIIWAGLRKHQPEITIREAGAMLVEAAQAMADAVNGGMPQGEDEPRPAVDVDAEDEEAGTDADAGPILPAETGTGTTG